MIQGKLERLDELLTTEVVTIISSSKPLSTAIVQTSSRLVYTWIRVNDPSAGSPTETLLRLLLPLNVQVYVSLTSSLEAEAKAVSLQFTKTFNR